jgi:hemolysin activation/secretion protein
LLNSEQFAGGGLGTARGYLEAEALGDNAFFGTLELRSPSLLGWTHKPGNDWRVFVFCDAGFLTLYDTLPEQENRFDLASVGVGSRIRVFDHFNGSVDAGLALLDEGSTQANDIRVTFRLWADF